MARLDKLFTAGLLNHLPTIMDLESKDTEDQANNDIREWKEKGEKLKESLLKKQQKISNNDKLTDTQISRLEAETDVQENKIALNDLNIRARRAQLNKNDQELKKIVNDAIGAKSRLDRSIEISEDRKKADEQENLERQATKRNNLGNNEDKMKNQQNHKFVDKSRKFSKSGYSDERDKLISHLLSLREAKNTRQKESILNSIENVSKNIKDNRVNELILSLVSELKRISINDSQYDQIISDTIENMRSESVTRLFSDKSIKAITRFYAYGDMSENPNKQAYQQYKQDLSDTRKRNFWNAAKLAGAGYLGYNFFKNGGLQKLTNWGHQGLNAVDRAANDSILDQHQWTDKPLVQIGNRMVPAHQVQGLPQIPKVEDDDGPGFWGTIGNGISSGLGAAAKGIGNATGSMWNLGSRLIDKISPNTTPSTSSVPAPNTSIPLVIKPKNNVPNTEGTFNGKPLGNDKTNGDVFEKYRIQPKTTPAPQNNQPDDKHDENDDNPLWAGGDMDDHYGDA